MRATRIALLLSVGASLLVHVGTGVAVHRLGREKEQQGRKVAEGLTGDTLETAPEFATSDALGSADTTGGAGLTTASAEAPSGRADVATSDPTSTAALGRAGRSARGAERSPSSAGTRGGAPQAEPGLYGAVGDRAAVDLATAFTRALPNLASLDPSWHRAPFGAAGRIRVIFTLDESGRLSDVSVGEGSPLLRTTATKTIALLRARSFVSRGARTTLDLDATVSPDEVHDGLHGDVFAVGASYTNRDGSAFFALAIGRRVDIRVRAR